MVGVGTIENKMLDYCLLAGSILEVLLVPAPDFNIFFFFARLFKDSLTVETIGDAIAATILAWGGRKGIISGKAVLAIFMIRRNHSPASLKPTGTPAGMFGIIAS